MATMNSVHSIKRQKTPLGDGTWSYNLVLPKALGESLRSAVKSHSGRSIAQFIRDAISEKITQESH